MSGTALFLDDLFLEHHTGRSHPESPSRLVSIREKLEKQSYAGKFRQLERRFARPEEIALVHDIEYVRSLEPFCKSGGGYLDGDTPVSEKSYDAALLAAGSGLAASDALLNGEIERALLLVRPPGHHSLQRGAMGFCLFNNIAITARYLRSRGIQKIAILDWDVHHGNGTQDTFYSDNSVFFISLHQYPFYPGSGAARETGEGPGTGFTLNLPMPSGYGDAQYEKAFHEKILPGLLNFQPEILLISAGFDAHEDDPLAGMTLSTEFYSTMTRWMREFAQKHCKDRIISFLEGGYNLSALADSVEAHAAGML